MSRPAPSHALADVVGLADGELREFSVALAGLLAADDVDGARRLIADWALTVRIRNHPDYASNAAAFAVAMESQGFPGQVA